MGAIFQVGVKALIRRDDTFLVVRHTAGSRSWDLPGGRMERGESIEQALRRELSEELPGIRIDEIGRQVHTCLKPRPPFPDGSALMLVVHAVTAQVPDDLQLSDEHDEFRWATAAQIADLTRGFILEALALLAPDRVDRHDRRGSEPVSVFW
jgi:8-oxo-dGTP pyrophosphatase MutT (NUDIX family)